MAGGIFRRKPLRLGDPFPQRCVALGAIDPDRPLRWPDHGQSSDTSRVRLRWWRGACVAGHSRDHSHHRRRAATPADFAARVRRGARHADVDCDPHDHLACVAQRHRHWRAPRLRPDQRRDRSADLHGGRQRQHQPQYVQADVGAASGYQQPHPGRPRPASARLERRAADLGGRARGHHRRPDSVPGAETIMNTLAPDAFDVSIAKIEDKPVKLETSELDFYYGANHALKGVSIPFAEKSVTALIGPSGCGKSTLLRALNRMYALYTGQGATGKIMFDGEDILRPGVNLSMLRARIGMVFQKPTPFPMSIHDNVAFGVRLYRSEEH